MLMANDRVGVDVEEDVGEFVYIAFEFLKSLLHVVVKGTTLGEGVMIAVLVRVVQQVVGDEVRVPQFVGVVNACVDDFCQLREFVLLVQSVALLQFALGDGWIDGEVRWWRRGLACAEESICCRRLRLIIENL